MIEPDLLDGNNFVGLFVACLVDYTVCSFADLVDSLELVVLEGVGGVLLVGGVHFLCGWKIIS